jgi:hypothetical protein
VTTFSRPDPFAFEYAAQARHSVSPGTGYAETLELMGTRLLDLSRAAAAAQNVELPSRQLWYPAPIPADCEQLAALFNGWTPFPPADGPTVCQPWRWQAGWSLVITRCTPAMPTSRVSKAVSAVPAEKMMQAGRIASRDAEVLLEVLNRIPGEVGSDVGVVTNAPSGGFQTVELNVSLISGGSL